MRFNYADGYVFAAIVAPSAFAEHAVSFADSRGVSEEKFEDAFGFFGGRSFSSHSSGVSALWCSRVLWAALQESWARITPCGNAFRTRTLRYVPALCIVPAITFVYRKLLPVNQTTVALTFLLAILAVSTVWGLRVSVFMSVAAMLAFNYFFLPPVGKFTIADPQNWVALVAFLGTSLWRANWRRACAARPNTAQRQRREIERLYSFSQQLLV